jgi:hypothetical protein
MKLVLSILLLVLTATAQDRLQGAHAYPYYQTPAPGSHTFWTAGNVAANGVNIGAALADVLTTRRALQVPGTRELNPVMRNQGAAIAFKLGVVGLGFGLSYAAYRTGHNRAAKIIPLLLAAPQFAAAGHNATVGR